MRRGRSETCPTGYSTPEHSMGRDWGSNELIVFEGVRPCHRVAGDSIRMGSGQRERWMQQMTMPAPTQIAFQLASVSQQRSLTTAVFGV